QRERRVARAGGVEEVDRVGSRFTGERDVALHGVEVVQQREDVDRVVARADVDRQVGGGEETVYVERFKAAAGGDVDELHGGHGKPRETRAVEGGQADS